MFMLPHLQIGLLKININNIQQNYSILPVGPLYNNVFSISSLYGNLWATFGDYTLFYNPYPLVKKRDKPSGLTDIGIILIMIVSLKMQLI